MRDTYSRSFAAILAAAAGAAVAAPQGPSDADIEAAKKNAGPVELRRAQVDAVYAQRRAEPVKDPTRVVYGNDDRIEVWQETDARLRAVAEAACVVVFASELTNNGDGTYTLHTTPYTTGGWSSLCPDEPFYGQPTIGFCSGFLVGEDLVTTAGHCVSPGEADEVAFVFGFQINQQGGSAPAVVPEEYVYFGTTALSSTVSGGLDHAVIRLDRPVTGISPVPLARDNNLAEGEPLALIGHPATIPKKIAAGAVVKNPDAHAYWFQANLDAYGGNSGSMVVNLNTYEVEGILVRGAPDYNTSGGCARTNYVPDSGNTGSGLRFEEVSKTIGFMDFVPELGLSALPGGPTLHIGAVGGPFSNDATPYTLRNPGDEAVSYTVALGGPDGFLQIDGPAAGSIPAGGAVTVGVSLASAADALPAGLYTQEVSFTDTTNGRTVTSTHTLEVGLTVIAVDGASLVTGGPVGGPFSGSSEVTVTSERPTPVTVAVSRSEPWISIDGAAADAQFVLSGVGASESFTVGIAPSAASLPAGLYTGEVYVDNVESGEFETIAVFLDVGRYVFDAPGLPAPIADHTTTTSTIQVPDAFCVGDVDVDIDIAHTYVGDLVLELTSPTGHTVVLRDREGGGQDDLLIRYDDEVTPPSGPGALADFAGGPAAGAWTLRVTDEAGSDTGALRAWSLRIAASGEPCPPHVAGTAVHLHPNTALAIDLEVEPVGAELVTTIVRSLPENGVLWTSEPLPRAILSVPFELPSSEVIYRADVGFVGTDAFTFSARGEAESEAARVDIAVGGQTETIAFFSLDENPGWSTDTGWQFGVPAGNGGDPSSAHTGDNVFGFNLNGAYQNNIPNVRYLTTGPIDLSNVEGATLRFYRWLGIESSSWDHANIQASAGGSWQTVWEHGSGSFTDAAWTLVEYDISAIVDGAADARVRWGLGPTDGSVTYAGWNIDDVEIVGARTDRTYPASDVDGDGQINVNDLLAYLGAFRTQQPIADLNGDGAVDVNDLLAYLGAFRAGS